MKALVIILAAMVLVSESHILQERVLTAQCCSQCFESRMMSTIFTPNRTVALIFNYLKSNVPSVFISNFLKYSPAAYTE